MLHDRNSELQVDTAMQASASSMRLELQDYALCASMAGRITLFDNKLKNFKQNMHEGGRHHQCQLDKDTATPSIKSTTARRPRIDELALLPGLKYDYV